MQQIDENNLIKIIEMRLMLENIINNKGLDDDEVIRVSRLLDDMINEYYKLIVSD